jgi:hypothetical protein
MARNKSYCEAAKMVKVSVVGINRFGPSPDGI